LGTSVQLSFCFGRTVHPAPMIEPNMAMAASPRAKHVHSFSKPLQRRLSAAAGAQ
jgi:hypothetical protein